MSWQHAVEIEVVGPSGRPYRRVFIRNEAYDTDRLAKLRTSMATFGWSGEPLVLQELDGTLFAFTGSHRLTVASELGVEPDVAWMPDLSEKANDLIHGAYDDDDLLSAIEDAGWKREGFEEVVAVMRSEVAANGRWMEHDTDVSLTPASAWP